MGSEAEPDLTREQQEAQAARQLRDVGAMALVVLLGALAIAAVHAKGGFSWRETHVLLAFSVAGLQLALIIVKVREYRGAYAKNKVDTLPLSYYPGQRDQ